MAAQTLQQEMSGWASTPKCVYNAEKRLPYVQLVTAWHNATLDCMREHEPHEVRHSPPQPEPLPAGRHGGCTMGLLDTCSP